MTCVNVVEIWCDHAGGTAEWCREHLQCSQPTHRDARAMAAAKRWVVLDGLDYCPKHASLGES